MMQDCMDFDVVEMSIWQVEDRMNQVDWSVRLGPARHFHLCCST